MSEPYDQLDHTAPAPARVTGDALTVPNGDKTYATPDPEIHHDLAKVCPDPTHNHPNSLATPDRADHSDSGDIDEKMMNRLFPHPHRPLTNCETCKALRQSPYVFARASTPETPDK